MIFIYIKAALIVVLYGNRRVQNSVKAGLDTVITEGDY